MEHNEDIETKRAGRVLSFRPKPGDVVEFASEPPAVDGTTVTEAFAPGERAAFEAEYEAALARQADAGWRATR